MFNRGDIVECVDNTGRKFLTLGKTYQVADVHPNGTDIYVLNDDGKIREVLASRFILSMPAPSLSSLPKYAPITTPQGSVQQDPSIVAHSFEWGKQTAKKYVPPKFFPGTSTPIPEDELWKYEMEAFYAAGCPQDWNKKG
jgi:hypothetical protein